MEHVHVVVSVRGKNLGFTAALETRITQTGLPFQTTTKQIIPQINSAILTAPLQF